MPIFEYVCRNCDEEFEWLVRSNGEEPTCPACGQQDLTQRLSVPAAHTSGASQAPCPPKESGSCGMSDCCGDRCNLADWG